LKLATGLLIFGFAVSFDSLFPALFIQKSLKYERCGHLVYNAAVLLAGASCFIENLVRLAGGQTLVAQVDGQAGEVAQFRGEGLSCCRLAALGSIEMQRVPGHNSGYAKAASEAGERTQIFAPAAAAFQREHRLCGQAEFVRDGHADTPVADIDAQKSGG
jgi:hypothetical protein